MNMPVRGSKLDPYGEEILKLHREGRKLGEISKHLAQTYGLSVALSTLSEYVNRPRVPSPALPPTAAIGPAPAPATTPAQEMLLDQVTVYAEIQASIRVLVEEVQAMRTAFPDLTGLERRLDALAWQLNGLKTSPSAAPPAPVAEELKALAPRLQAFLDNQQKAEQMAGHPVPYVLIRRIWARAFWSVTGLWLFFFVVATYWLGFWRLPAPLVQWGARLIGAGP